ncbi:MAG TPA: reactive intermediate/imine deaminase [Flavobacteriales bacterium]|nr:reactive intermediate/imine deaminase [Flavobacteriales bacterium]
MKQIINSKKSPAPIGPYSQAVQKGNTLYVSGQIALDPISGELNLSTISAETELVMKNLGEVLKAANMTYENVLKCSIFLSDMKNFSEVNEIYGKYFTTNPPARETVAVKTLPKNVNVEISCIAAL